MNPIRKHILFDLDGTLTDPAEGICGSVRFALESLGYPVPEQKVLEGFIGPPLDESFIGLCGLSPAEIPAAVEAFRDYFTRQGIRENKLFPGMDALLKRLCCSGYTLYVATSKPLQLANTVLGNFAIDGCFCRIAGSGLDHVGRPKAEVVAEVLREENIAPQNAVMVGDRRHDVAGAHACGLPCVGVLFGYGGLDELQQAGAEYLAHSVPHLEEILTGL